MNLFTLSNRSSARIFAALALFSLLASLIPMQVFAQEFVAPDVVKKVDICKANQGSDFTPGYQNVAINSISNGLANSGQNFDIVPPIVEFPEGINWETLYGGFTGEEIWNNRCVPPTGSLTVVKEVVNDNGGTKSSADFPLFITLGAGSPVSVTSGAATTNLAPGTYTVSETHDPNYTASFGASCPNGQITIAAGQNKTCTITNNDNQSVPTTGTIIVDKVTLPAEAAQSFEFTTTGTGFTGFSLTDAAAPNTQASLNPGTYSVVETAVDGWTQLSALCSDGSPVNAISLQAGETVTCTFTNVKDIVGPVLCTDIAATNFGQEERCIYNYVSECINPDANLLVNGSFEDPAITDSWAKSPVTGWAVALVSSGTSTLGEIWRGLVTPSDLAQNLELAVDLPTKITQSTTTISGATYELRFDFAARLKDAADNRVFATADTNTIVDASTANTNWTTYGGTFVADASTDITLADMGTPDSYGTLVDNAVLCLVEMPVVDFCPNIEGNQAVDSYAKDVNGQCYTPIESCSVSVVSDTSNTVNDSAALLVTPNGGWASSTLVSPLAKWIWGASPDLPISPVTDETQTFKKTFVWSGTPATATLEISSDNGYLVKLNGVVVGSDADEFNYQSIDTIIDISDELIQGVNTLEISVTNKANGETTWASNPGGLVYDLTITKTEGACTPGGGGGNTLSCEISADDITISRGGDVTLNWSAVGASSATITGIDGDISLPGSRRIENLRDDTTYTMTVIGEDEKQATCSVTIDTRSGGGGGGTRTGNRNPAGTVLGESTSVAPTPLVLGEQVSVVPTGAPDAGAGGSTSKTVSFFTVTSLAIVRRSQKNG